MGDRVRVTVAAVRRRTVRVVPAGVRAPCRVCGREVEALSTGRAAEVLEVSKGELADLTATGRVHAIPTAGGGLRVCKDSLFPS